MKPLNDSSKREPIGFSEEILEKITASIVWIWVVALTILIGYGFFIGSFIKKEVGKIYFGTELIRKSSFQNTYVQRIGYFVNSYAESRDSQSRESIKKELQGAIDNLRTYSNWFSQEMSSPQMAVYPSLSEFYFKPPHNIKDRVEDFVDHAQLLLDENNALFAAENPHVIEINKILTSGQLSKSLAEFVKECQDISRQELLNLYRTGGWLLSSYLLLLLFINVFIIFPLFKRVRRQFSDLDSVSQSVKDQARDLRRYHVATLSMMEDAQIARKEAEHGRDAAIRLAHAVEEREQWFRSLIENSADLLIQLDKEGTIIYISPSVNKIIGYTPEEKIGKSVFELIHPEDLPEIMNLFKEVIQEPGKIVSSQARVAHKNGTWRWLEGSGHNLLHDKNIKAVVVNCRDVSERKIAIDEIKREKDRAQQYLDTAGVMLLALNEEGQIILINKKGLNILGFQNEGDVLGKNFFETFIPKLERKKTKEIIHELMTGKVDRMENFETRITIASGEQRVIQWCTTAILDDSRRIIGILSSGQDITEQQQIEVQLNQYMHELKRSNEELESFAFIASHDLQEPLRIVSTYVNLLASRYKDKVEKSDEKYLGYIVNNITRMRNMIQGLLAYSRVGKANDRVESVDTNKICDQAIFNLKFIILKKKAEVTRDNLPVILGTETEILQVFQNLVNNALKYCDKPIARVHISAFKKNSDWTFSVQDNGIGIEAQYYKQIFEIFRRLHTQSEYPGTGIGLAVCKKIIENNGGNIWVESKLGEGSTFYFTSPIKGEVIHEYHETH